MNLVGRGLGPTKHVASSVALASVSFCIGRVRAAEHVLMLWDGVKQIVGRLAYSEV
jgi:hypothetical protein